MNDLPSRSGATILDVARKAGVSPGTVSNVINGGVPVSDARRDRVLGAIAELRYFPNSLAQGLRRKQANIIGMCIPHMASGYMAALATALEDLATANGFSVVQAFSRQDPALELRRVQALLGSRLAGLILVPSTDPQASFELIRRAGTPAIVVDRLWDTPDFDFVTMDNHSAMSELADTLAALGHRRLLYVVSHPSLVTTRHRIQALGDAQLRHAGLAATTLQCPPNEADFTAALAALMAGPERPSSIIGSNSIVTMWLIRALKALGISVPGDVSLVSFEEPEWADIVSPELAVVQHPTSSIAAAAIDTLLARIAGSTEATRHVQLFARYKPGPSVAPPR